MASGKGIRDGIVMYHMPMFTQVHGQLKKSGKDE